MSVANAIEVDDLRRTFTRRAPGALTRMFSRRRAKACSGDDGRRPAALVAVDGISFGIRTGEIFGLLGPNGAGKTTTIKMLCTLLEPTSGTARVAGFDIVREPARARASLGTVLSGERSLYWKLTGRENLEYFAALYDVEPITARERITELLDRFELTDKANELVERYSTGMRQRLSIARALLANPPVLLLDEPTAGLDPQSARNLREVVRKLKDEGHTILLTTHYMAEADELSDRIAIIDHGKVIALDSPTALKQHIQQMHSVEVETDRAPDGILDELRSLPLVRGVECVQSG
ncbi:MAG TPA: ABC transporter ATP-binding protein, partial [Bacillota bacterium]|nr:ABC transporter ATP-binding protein [Bacillota bacterium]